METWNVSKLFSRGGLVSSTSNGKVYSPLTRLVSSNCAVYSDHIAVDFGDSYTRVAVMEGRSAKIIDTSPSVVAFNEKGEILFGTKAKHRGVTHPGSTIYGINRLMGRKFDDPIVQNEMKRVSYNIVKGPDGDACIEVYGNVYSPFIIREKIMTNIKKTAESYVGEPVCKAIISIPPACTEDNNTVRKERETSETSELHVQVHLYDGICPVISSNLIKKEGLVAILNMGGRTFGASVLEITNHSREWKSKKYDMFLGGEDFDNALMEYLMSEFKKSEEIDLKNDHVAIQRLRAASEKAKMELSYLSETEVNLPYIASAAIGAKHLNVTVSRSTFERLVDDLIKRVRSACESCLHEAGITGSEVDEVLLVGGMSRVPKLRTTVAEIFGKSPRRIRNPDEVVALGAAAAIQEGGLPEDTWKQFEELAAVCFLHS
ncbi:hypothetical protein ACHQM5_001500 [Ranunculus cassubicifolius]